MLLGILLAVMLGNLRERRATILARCARFMDGRPLIAGRFEGQFATASAARWSVAIFLLARPSRFRLAEAGRRKKRMKFRDAGAGALITLGPLILLTLFGRR